MQNFGGGKGGRTRLKKFQRIPFSFLLKYDTIYRVNKGLI